MWEFSRVLNSLSLSVLDVRLQSRKEHPNIGPKIAAGRSPLPAARRDPGHASSLNNSEILALEFLNTRAGNP